MLRKQHAPWRALMVAVLGLGALHAQALPAAKTSHPYLWKIEGGGKKASWLFGTIHLQRPEVTELAPAVSAALNQSDAVYTEIPADVASMLALTPKMMLPDGKSLDKMLGPLLIADLEKELQAIQPMLPLEPLLKFKPWALAAMLFQLEDQMKYPGSLALDMVLFQQAATMGKETGGIETPEEQLAAFEGFSEAEQTAMIKDTVRQLREFRAKGQSVSDFLTKLYLAGDLDKLVNELNKLDAAGDDPKLSAKFMDRLLYRRNAIMAARIVQRLRQHPETSYFFAIGAAHLQGNRGLIAALEKAGFRLTRVQ